MSDDLEAILTGEDGAEESAEQPRSEDGKFASSREVEQPDVTEEAVEAQGEEPTEEVADTSPVSEEPKVEDDAISAMKAELARIRAKNRELEERVTAKQEPEERLDFFEDPDKALQTMEQRMEQKIARARIDWSEQSARQRYGDFDAKVGEFTAMANENPMLWQQMAASPDPAEFAYKQASNAIKMREIGSIDDFETRIRKEEQAKHAAELKAFQEKLAQYEAASGLPGSLSGKRAAGGNSSPPVTNEALEDILGR